VRYGKFPTIEKHMLAQRSVRVAKNRDRSRKWWDRTVKKLLSDQSALDALPLTQYEREHVYLFKATEGWTDKVMVCGSTKLHLQMQMFSNFDWFLGPTWTAHEAEDLGSQTDARAIC
jgi:hypothetical protein